MPQSVLERKRTTNGQTTAEWYFRHDGCNYGPYDTASLRDVIVAARIAFDLQLRQANASDWREVSSVSELLIRLETGLPPLTDQTIPDSADIRKPAPSSRQAAGGENARPQTTTGRLFRRTRTRPTFFRSFGRGDLLVLVALFCMLAGINAVVFGSIMMSQSTEQKYSRDMLLIWDELRELRRHSASDQEWSDFAARSEATLAPIVKDLEKKADVDHSELQHLLWAGRDHLPRMLHDARKAPSQSEQLFERHMEEARRPFTAR